MNLSFKLLACRGVLWCFCKLHVTDWVCFAHCQPPVWNTPHPHRLKQNDGATSCRQRALHCWCSFSSSPQRAALTYVTWPDLVIIQKVILASADKVLTDRFICLRPVEKGLIRLGALSKPRALDEVSAAWRGALWERSVRAVHKEGERTEARALRSPDLFTLYRGTEEHRCAVFYAQPRSGPERASVCQPPCHRQRLRLQMCPGLILQIQMTAVTGINQVRGRETANQTVSNSHSSWACRICVGRTFVALGTHYTSVINLKACILEFYNRI